jgi:uncharacterized protein (TIGR03086 family)
MDIVDLGPAAQQLSDLLARAGQDDLGRPTPCPAYALGDLIEHVGGMALAFTAAARKDAGPLTEQQPSGDAARLPADWRTRIPNDLAALAQAWREPDAWAGMTRIASMDAPAEMVGQTVADELTVHGWDLARALGQPYRADPEVLAAARAFLEQFASPDAPAGPDVPFGPSRPVAGDAPALDQVLALAGRDTDWTPS